MKNVQMNLDDEINSIMNYIEETNYSVAQGYKVSKVFRDKQAERKNLVKEVICLESILEYTEVDKLVQAFQDSIKLSDEKIKNGNKITFVKELKDDAV